MKYFSETKSFFHFLWLSANILEKQDVIFSVCADVSHTHPYICTQSVRKIQVVIDICNHQTAHLICCLMYDLYKLNRRWSNKTLNVLTETKCHKITQLSYLSKVLTYID